MEPATMTAPTTQIAGEAMTDEWRTAFDDRHEFDVYPEHFMSGLRNEFAAGWHAAMKSQARALLASKPAVPADLLPNALWTRNGSGSLEWWSFKGYEARKDSADQWVLRKAGEELYRHTYLQVVMAHAERELLAASPTAPAQLGQWVHCSPALLKAGIRCANTPRRACACEPENGGHDHFVAHEADPAQSCGDAEQADEAVTVTPAMVKAAMPWLTGLQHMRKTDKESHVEEAIRAAFTARAKDSK
jgi:hypothetical protein